MSQKDAIPDIHRVADLATRQALKSQADMVNAARAEARTLRRAGEATAEALDELRSDVSRLGGLRPVLETLNSNVNIAVDHPWFLADEYDDDSVPTGTWNTLSWVPRVKVGEGFLGWTPADLFSTKVFVGRKPGLWRITVSVVWASNATGNRVLRALGTGGGTGQYTARHVSPAFSGDQTYCIATFDIPTNVPGAYSAPIDFVQFAALQDSGGDLNRLGADTRLVAYYVAPLP
jgi:hypothetical protein